MAVKQYFCVFFSIFMLTGAGRALAQNSSTSPAPPILSTGIYDDGDPNVVYTGSWKSGTDTINYNQTNTYSKTAGSIASFTFNGTQVTYVYDTHPNMGYAQVAIDGAIVAANLDEYTQSNNRQQATYSGLSNGVHTITITVLGTKDSQATNSYVTVDAFIVNQASNNINQVSIRNWVSCSGEDESVGVAAAFEAARNNAFTLKVDCPVFIHIGTDITRPIFIDNNTTVQFTSQGLFTVDNVLLPAFVIADSSNIQLLNWNIQYTGGIPVDYATGGYYDNGVYVPLAGNDVPGGKFNDDTLAPWLKANRGLVYDGVRNPWGGPTDMSAVFFLTGAVGNLEVNGLKMFAPAGALGSHYIPVAFASVEGFRGWQTVSAATPAAWEYMAVPYNVQFSNIQLDGYYMGWQGPFQTTSFNNVVAYRYADLQDDQGGNVGGIGKWFAPPHLFYINYTPGQSGLDANNVEIANVIDWGVRTGVARDKAGEAGSGSALSLKIGANNSAVNAYYSFRPDGFLDVLTSENLSIQNAIARYNSAFLNNLYPGIRFPIAPYVNLTIANINLTDTAETTIYPPVASTGDPGNNNIVFTGSGVFLNAWQNSGYLCPYIRGAQDLSIQFSINGFSSGNPPVLSCLQN